jgi:hypothetical protein
MSIWTLGAAAVAVFWSLEWATRTALRKRRGSDGRTTQALRDRFTAWRNNPAFHRSDIRMNTQGFRRNRNVSLRKPAATRRLFLLGGSTAYGAQGGFTHIDSRWSRIHNHELIDAFLEKQLNAAVAPAGDEVINAAVSGYRMHQQLALIQSRLRRYQPDDVILMDGYNDFIQLYNWARSGHQGDFDVYGNTPGYEDFDSLANPGSMRSLLIFGAAWLRARSSLMNLASSRLSGSVRNPWRSVIPAVQPEFNADVRWGDLNGDERIAATAALEHVSYYAATTRQIHRILGLDGVRPIFLLQPILILAKKPLTKEEQLFVQYEWQQGGPLYFYLFREVYRRFDQEMSEAARDEGFRYLNLVNVFDSTGEQTFSDFAHLTPAGNRIIAGKLFGELCPPGLAV